MDHHGSRAPRYLHSHSRVFRNRMSSMASRCSEKRGEPDEFSRSHDPVELHPYMLDTARILKRRSERVT